MSTTCHKACLHISEIHLVLYMQYLRDSVGSKSAVETAVNCIAWVHELAGYPPISSVLIVVATLKGLQHLLGKPITRKEPITSTMLQAMVASMPKTPLLSDIRLAAVALMAYAAFLRFDEVSKLCYCDVEFCADHMMVHIVSSKTDQYKVNSGSQWPANLPCSYDGEIFFLGRVAAFIKRETIQGHYSH